MPNLSLCKDRERGFTIQDSGNHSLGIFYIREFNGYFQARFIDIRKKEESIIYHGRDKQSAIIAAYGAARYVARKLDMLFEDCTGISEPYMGRNPFVKLHPTRSNESPHLIGDTDY